MADNRIQIKRTAVAGRTANTTDSGNSQYITAGEFALNMPDGILYTSNGSALITVGSNLVNQNITGNLTVKAIIANGSLGSAADVLTSNGSSVYWTPAAGGSGALSYTANVGNNSNTTFDITHGLNTTTIIPAVREIATGYYVYPDMKVTSTNNIVLEFVSAPTANQYLLILLGV